jgi:hypothetical protein
MKIAQLLSGIGVVLTNEERQFVDKHQTHVSINSLSEHEQWIAQNLVRKGIYSISNDSRSIIKKLDETINRRYLHQDTAT